MVIEPVLDSDAAGQRPTVLQMMSGWKYLSISWKITGAYTSTADLYASMHVGELRYASMHVGEQMK